MPALDLYLNTPREANSSADSYWQDPHIAFGQIQVYHTSHSLFNEQPETLLHWKGITKGSIHACAVLQIGFGKQISCFQHNPATAYISELMTGWQFGFCHQLQLSFANCILA